MSAFIALSFGALFGLTDSSLVASQVIRAGDSVTPANATLPDGDLLETGDPLLGREVKRTVYAGQPITEDNTRPARLVTRNQIVTVKYIQGGLEISTTGRAMGEASLNEEVTVLNLQSRQLIKGTVQDTGWVLAQ